MAAMIGEEALVPPTSFQPPLPSRCRRPRRRWSGRRPRRRRCRSRLVQPDRPRRSARTAAARTVEQPEPVPSEPAEVFHTDSVQPREFERCSAGAADRDDVRRGAG